MLEVVGEHFQQCALVEYDLQLAMVQLLSQQLERDPQLVDYLQLG